MPASAAARPASAAASALSHAAANTAAARRPQVFLLSSSPDSLADLRRHGSAVGVVYPTFYDCKVGSGALVGAASADVSNYAQLRGLRLMPRFNCQDGTTVHRILTNPALRAATLARLTSIGTSGTFRGICLDLENDSAQDREAMSSFVTALATALHAHGRRLAVVVVGVTHEDAEASTGFYDDRAIGAVADSVFVLAWGTHWEGSEPGPISTLPFAKGVASFVSSLPNAGKFVLGAPMYGLDWPLAQTAPGQPQQALGEASAYEYADIAALVRRVHARPRRDAASQELTFTYTDEEGQRHVVWYMDAHAVAATLRIGREAGLGIGLWRLGSEDQRLWYSPVLRG